MTDTHRDSPPPLLVRDRDGCIVAARPAPTWDSPPPASADLIAPTIGVAILVAVALGLILVLGA